MTITISEVQEIIKNIESVGELSIKEEKYLNVAKLCVQLAAENVSIREQSEEVYAAGYNHGHLNTVDGIEYAGCVKDDFYSLALQVMAEVETPATDRIVAGIKADGRAEGINFAAIRLAADFNHGFVDKPMAEVGDVVRMILTAKEDLANDPVLAADGLSGEYAEKSLAEWEAELREGADK